MSRLYGLAALKRPVNRNKINKASMAINEIMDPLYVLKADEVEEKKDDAIEDLEEDDDEDDLDEDEEDDEDEEEELEEVI
ncbi:MAG: hypothetical protein UT29_C0001G0071 [Candidatus Yanofskybacteria bacterium GW2011_GWA1_39_13]|uniref:Uncharacterized protein n=1 Tax=Yanofskybacteria sp. (strain GW2011_GWA1_39_13) TaxID=1619019 RepID=A0A0G0MQ86_YANXG|nr:MAG: hypothetical protein UT29_C0001G0071 [Candidatus Yanofskybacteria bacterium GW2011_GWA1_39_13]